MILVLQLSYTCNRSVQLVSNDQIFKVYVFTFFIFIFCVIASYLSCSYYTITTAQSHKLKSDIEHTCQLFDIHRKPIVLRWRWECKHIDSQNDESSDKSMINRSFSRNAPSFKAFITYRWDGATAIRDLEALEARGRAPRDLQCQPLSAEFTLGEGLALLGTPVGMTVIDDEMGRRQVAAGGGQTTMYGTTSVSSDSIPVQNRHYSHTRPTALYARA